MAWRLDRHLMPELSHFPDKASEQSARILAEKHCYRGWRRVIPYVMMIIMGPTTGFIAVNLAIRVTGILNELIFLVVIAGLTGGVTVALLLCDLFVLNERRRFLRSELSRLGRPICDSCGYDLRGHATAAVSQTMPRCPECGASTR